MPEWFWSGFPWCLIMHIMSNVLLAHFQTIVSVVIVRVISMIFFFLKHKIREAFSPSSDYYAAILYILHCRCFSLPLWPTCLVASRKREPRVFLFTLFCSLCCFASSCTSVFCMFLAKFSKHFEKHTLGNWIINNQKLSQCFTYLQTPVKCHNTF